MESNPGVGMVGFDILQRRLRDLVNERISNGEFTERGFARVLGISQPQVHNVLKGARKLSYEMADQILEQLGLSVLDLLTEAELEWGKARRVNGAIPRKPPARDLRAPVGLRERAI